jgi:hypothetical protein
MRRVEKLEEEVERERRARVEVRLYWVDRETGRTIDAFTMEEVTGVVFDE